MATLDLSFVTNFGSFQRHNDSENCVKLDASAIHTLPAAPPLQMQHALQQKKNKQEQITVWHTHTLTLTHTDENIIIWHVRAYTHAHMNKLP